MRIVMKGTAPLVEPGRPGDLDATVSWNFVWKLRRTVVGEGCLEVGRRSGFVCVPERF
jgi:hypothetical protein